jgi:NAD(P)-dependent dehydrogenase (short-subunit alcohol dehydrogenase family)
MMESRSSAEHNTITIVTGAHNGIGFETAKTLAGIHGHTVVMACHDLKNAETAKADILKLYPQATLDIMQLDLADLDSVSHFCATFSTRYPRLDLLINNAGILDIPNGKTKQGLEITMGTNFFGPFALTAGLYPSLLNTTGIARIVTVGSSMHRDGSIDFNNFHGEKTGYTILQRYASSKLAGMMFAFRMARLFKENNIPIISVVVDPGAGSIKSTASEKATMSKLLVKCGLFIANHTIADSPAEGARRVVYAATNPDIQSGAHLSPSTDLLVDILRRGNLELTQASAQAYNELPAGILWSRAERLTNTNFTILPRENHALTSTATAAAAARIN